MERLEEDEWREKRRGGGMKKSREVREKRERIEEGKRKGERREEKGREKERGERRRERR